MGIVDLSSTTGDSSDTAEASRVAAEADMIAAAEESLRAGHVISHEQFLAWSRSLLENLDRPHAPPA